MSLFKDPYNGYSAAARTQGAALGLAWQGDNRIYNDNAETGESVLVSGQQAGLYDKSGNWISPDLVTSMSSLALTTQHPNANAGMLVDPGQFAGNPQDTTAALLRMQYADYMDRYRPSEDALMNMTTYDNPELVGQEIDKAIGTADKSGYVQKAMDTAEATQSYGMRKFGVQQTAETAQATGMKNNLARSTAVVDAANKIRMRQSDRNQQIATGVVPNAGRAYGLKSETGGM